jgi:pyruvate dehydrogenase E1 component alpha subunit
VIWCRELRLRQILGMFRGVSLGGWNPQDHHIHLYSIVIPDHVLHATGYAMGVQRDGNVGTGDADRDMAVIAYFGDGAMSQGDLNESLVFATSFNAPMVFFCQNNHWAISVPTQRQSRIPLYRRASGFGLPGVRVDGNDVLAVLAVTRAALDRARGGGGPTLIEAVTYRMAAHTTSDDPTRYRSAAEVDHWKHRDPLARLATLLRATGDGGDDFFAEIEEQADDIGQQVRDVVRSMPDPAPLSMFDHVYAEPHAQVDAERAWFADYHASFAAQPTVGDA